jgi:hypothetical protein
MADQIDPTDPTDSRVEAELRQLLADRAGTLASPATPYATIVRQGRAAQRRGRLAMGAGAAVLAAAVPGAAIGAGGLWSEGDAQVAAGPTDGSTPTQAPTPPSTPTQAPTQAPTPTIEPPAGPSDPERQLLDGITLEQARASLERCIAEFGPEVITQDPDVDAEVHIEPMRILLAWTSQGDENRGEDPIRQVLAVSGDSAAGGHTQFVCADRPGDGPQGMQSGTGGSLDNGMPVFPDVNAGRYLAPMMGEWELPFRWADFGLVAPEVERVTVRYGGVTEEAVLEAGYFVVAGIAEQPVGDGEDPVVLGYDADGAVVYDSRQDPGYDPVV